MIAVARDEAFCFYYPENLELLVEEGAEVEFFSPLRGERPSASAAAVYLGGGYPELHGQTLASNTDLWRALKDMHAANKPIYAECGGFMVLTEGLTDSEVTPGPWQACCLELQDERQVGRPGLPARDGSAAQSAGEPGESLRGHEFRYSTWDVDATATVERRQRGK